MAKSKKKTSAKSTGKAKGAASKAKPARKKVAVTVKPKTGAGSRLKTAKKAVTRKAASSPVKRKAASPPAKRVARASAPVLTAAAAEVALSRADALQKKLDAIKDLIKTLSANLTNTPADDDELNPNIDSLRNEQRALEAELAAAQTGTLAPPDDADVMALEKAVAAAEETIRKNGSVNELINAAAALIKTLKK